MKKFLVTYTDDYGDISTTEMQTFETLEEAQIFYDDQKTNKVPDLYLCEVLQHNTAPLPFSGTMSEMSQAYAAKINPELLDWDREVRFLICDLTACYIQKADDGYYTQAGGDEFQGSLTDCIKFIQENM